MKQEILLVKIQKALSEGKDHYDAVKGNWRINEKGWRASNML
ncbi:hypothetical protein [Bacillus sp. FJAT-52991]|uniref:Uncharacterized protein n=1 Tax=Bacillus kandeliae TaxID=3129297 RepID=A0ABZ2N1J1_9BACI